MISDGSRKRSISSPSVSFWEYSMYALAARNVKRNPHPSPLPSEKGEGKEDPRDPRLPPRPAMRGED